MHASVKSWDARKADCDMNIPGQGPLEEGSTGDPSEFPTFEFADITLKCTRNNFEPFWYKQPEPPLQL